MTTDAGDCSNAKPGSITLEMRHEEYGNDGITLVAQRCNGSIRRSEFNHLADRTRCSVA
jgi:hypothetical protein